MVLQKLVWRNRSFVPLPYRHAPDRICVPYWDISFSPLCFVQTPKTPILLLLMGPLSCRGLDEWQELWVHYNRKLLSVQYIFADSYASFRSKAKNG